MNNSNNDVNTTDSTCIKMFSAYSACELEKKVNEWLSEQRYPVRSMSQKIAGSDCNRFLYSVLIVHENVCNRNGEAHSLRVKIFAASFIANAEEQANNWLCLHSCPVHAIEQSVAGTDSNRFAHSVFIVYENDLK